MENIRKRAAARHWKVVDKDIELVTQRTHVIWFSLFSDAYLFLQLSPSPYDDAAAEPGGRLR